MIENLFRWLGATQLGIVMRDSTWGFAIVETVHLIGLTALGGAVLVVNLTALRVLFRRNDPAVVVRAALPVLYGSLAAMIVSGTLLLSSKPIRYFLDDTFRIKMALLVLAIVSSIFVTRLVVRPAGPATLLKILAFLSLLLWLGVGVSGRIIGFL